jgi:predicted transcriptional regulator
MAPKRKRRKLTSLRLDPKLLEKFKEIADAEGEAVSVIVRRAMREYLDKLEALKAKP